MNDPTLTPAVLALGLPDSWTRREDRAKAILDKKPTRSKEEMLKAAVFFRTDKDALQDDLDESLFFFDK